ncbi:MAG: ribbon-helix-helix domain-containing protein [Nanoarchaeota archaeon]
METITLRVDRDFAQEMEKAMRPYYSTKTEFIREAIREKLKQIRKENNALRRKH